MADRAEIGRLSASLIDTARKDWMTLENAETEMPLTMDFAQVPLPAAGRPVRCRSIYAAAVFDDAAGSAGGLPGPARRQGRRHVCCRMCQ